MMFEQDREELGERATAFLAGADAPMTYRVTCFEDLRMAEAWIYGVRILAGAAIMAEEGAR